MGSWATAREKKSEGGKGFLKGEKNVWRMSTEAKSFVGRFGCGRVGAKKQTGNQSHIPF